MGGHDGSLDLDSQPYYEISLARGDGNYKIKNLSRWTLLPGGCDLH